MIMPANYNVLTEEEMTYTDGGASVISIVGGALSTAVDIAVAAGTIYAAYVGISGARTWYKGYKAKNPTPDLGKYIDAAWNKTVSYIKGGDNILKKAGRAYVVYTAINYAPITALAMIL